MASTPPIDPRDDAFLREVDEAYREDELKKFIYTWGRWILLGIGVLLAGLGAWFFWQHQQVRNTEALSEEFSQALEQVDSGDGASAGAALEKLGVAKNDSYRALAQISAAGVAVNAGDTKVALAHLKAVADDARVTGPLHDAAVVKWLRLAFDDLPPAEVLKRTAPYLEGDNLWFPVAGELAALAHLKAGDSKAAGALFLRLAAAETAPASLRIRAEQMAASLGEDVTPLGERRAREQEASDGGEVAAGASEAAIDAAAAAVAEGDGQ